MLQFIREKAQGVIAWVIISTVAVTFIFVGLGEYFRPSYKAPYAAKVDGIKINEASIHKIYDQIMQQYLKQEGFDSSSLNIKNIKTNIRNALVRNQALVGAAKKYGFRLSDEQIAAKIISNPHFQENGIFSPEKYHKLLRLNRITARQYDQEINNELLIDTLQDGILLSAFYLKPEESQLHNILQQKRDFDYMIIPASKFFAQVKILPEQIKDYYEKNQTLFTAKDQVAISYIKAHALSIDKAEQLNKLAFEEQEPLEMVEKKLELNLEKTGLFSRYDIPSTLNPKIAAEAFAEDLIDGGQNSELIRLDEQTEIIFRVDKHVLPHQLDLAAVKPQVTKLLLQQEASSLAKKAAENVVQKLNARNIAPIKLAEQYKLKWIKKTALSRKAENDLNSEITHLAFSMPKPVNNKPTNGLFLLANGDYVVIALQKVAVKLDAQDKAQELAYIIGQYEYKLFENAVINSTKIELGSVN